MDIGELLYTKFVIGVGAQHVGAVMVQWQNLDLWQQQAWNYTAQLFLAEYGIVGASHIANANPTPAPAVPSAPPRNWKAELKKFGKHASSCPTSAPCNCGFGEIEKELAA